MSVCQFLGYFSVIFLMQYTSSVRCMLNGYRYLMGTGTRCLLVRLSVLRNCYMKTCIVPFSSLHLISLWSDNFLWLKADGIPVFLVFEQCQMISRISLASPFSLNRTVANVYSLSVRKIFFLCNTIHVHDNAAGKFWQHSIF